MQLSDADIAEALQSSDEKVFEYLFKQWYEPLCRYAAYLLRDNEEAEETVQQVFVNVWERRSRVQVQSFKSYLYGAVHHAVMNRAQHQKVREKHRDYVLRSDANDKTTNMYEAIHLSEQIDRAVAALPEQCRLVFQLSRYESFSYNEIAQHLNISVKTVENHMGKALKMLRVALKEFIAILIVFIQNFIQF